MALSSVRYREHRPIPALRSHVRVLWELAGACDDPAPQRMIPDGAMSLWLSFGAALTHVDGGVARGGTLFLGEVRRPFEIGSDGALDVIGVSFWPGRARAFVDAPLRELVDRSIADPPLVGALSQALARSVHGAEPEDRIALLQAALAEALVVARAPSPAVRRALALMDRDDGKLRIASLAEAVGVGARQLERLFVDEVGIAPKQLASVLRFRGALEGMVGGAELAALAQRCGYVDQSHLVRDFTRFAGTAPTRFVATELRRARREWLTRPRAAS